MSPGQPRRRGPVSPRRARPTHRRPRLPRLGPADRARHPLPRAPPPPTAPRRPRLRCRTATVAASPRPRHVPAPSPPSHAVSAASGRRPKPPSSASFLRPPPRPTLVGFIIGKAGETVKYLQAQSGAKIQVTRDMDVQPGSQTRSVDLSGTPDQINRAEQLIIGVLAEADARSSGTISNRKYNAAQPGAEQFQMQISNNKVIPLHLPPGDTSTERTLYIDGTAQQIEIAK
ncbi:far upstream element-binding protein 1-like [Triticum dicoccoides]|uniref:far upstream element-binding protein 1-like n=1 Tax=Triticum dicoccoides TaxID=85692 RepID=UPI00189199C5|nr:far upstream element-binding protein 1-like [Triticum dicoccoides]